MLQTYSSNADYNPAPFAMVAIAPRLARSVLLRRDRFEEMRSGDQDYRLATYWDNGATYYDDQSEWWELFPEGHEYVEVSDDAWQGETLWAGGREAVRTETETMDIDERGVLWQCHPKHGDVVITTERLPYSIFEEVLKNEG